MEKIIASKENAENAAKALLRLSGNNDDIKFMTAFIEAAKKRLPSESAIKKDRKRKTVVR